MTKIFMINKINLIFILCRGKKSDLGKKNLGPLKVKWSVPNQHPSQSEFDQEYYLFYINQSF